MTIRFALLFSIVGAVAACKTDPSLTPCADSTVCTLSAGGQCLPSPLGVALCAYADGDCASGMSWGEYGGSLAGACVESVDGGVDAPRVHAFDIAYVDEWRFSVAGPVDGYVAIVNTGAVGLSTSSFQVRSVADDHPMALVRVRAPATLAAVIPTGSAGGELTPLAVDLIVATGLVDEPRTDTDVSYLDIEIANAPTGTYDIHVDLVISLDGLDVPLPMIVHIVPGPTVYADPVAADRIEVFR